MPQVKTLSEYEAHLVNAVRDEYYRRLGGTHADAVEQIRRNLDLPVRHPSAAQLLERKEEAEVGLVVDLTPPAAPSVLPLRDVEPPWSL